MIHFRHPAQLATRRHPNNQQHPEFLHNHYAYCGEQTNNGYELTSLHDYIDCPACLGLIYLDPDNDTEGHKGGHSSQPDRS